MIIGCVTLLPLNPSTPNDYRQVAAINCAKGRGLILPGGKWEEGELFEEAAFREFKEETGHQLNGLPKLFFQGYSMKGNYTYTFLGEGNGYYNSGVVTVEGETRWALWDDLLRSEFRAYYSLLRQHCETNGYYTGVH